jgi:thioredoxin-like negative regulator of GroEL
MIELKTINEIEEFISNNDIVIAYFSTASCSVCKALKPKIQAISDLFERSQMIYSGIDQNQELSGKYMVFTVPTIILFIEGREYKRFARYVSTDDIKASIERYLELSE